MASYNCIGMSIEQQFNCLILKNLIFLNVNQYYSWFCVSVHFEFSAALCAKWGFFVCSLQQGRTGGGGGVISATKSPEVGEVGSVSNFNWGMLHKKREEYFGNISKWSVHQSPQRWDQCKSDIWDGCSTVVLEVDWDWYGYGMGRPQTLGQRWVQC